MSSRNRATPHQLLNVPELNVAIFSFLLNFVWEFSRCRSTGDGDHAALGAAQVCIQATFGDAGIALVAFWAVALGAGSRGWMVHATPRQISGFVAVEVAITIAFEWLATEVLDRSHRVGSTDPLHPAGSFRWLNSGASAATAGNCLWTTSGPLSTP